MAISSCYINSSILTSKLHMTKSTPTFPISVSPHPWRQPTPTNLSLKHSDTKIFSIPNPTYTESEEKLAARWKEIHGKSDWVGLLDPLDPVLRSELIRYGEMAQACYEAFDCDPLSKDYGSCKYPQEQHFRLHGYTVTRYLYATSTIDLPYLLHKFVFCQKGDQSRSSSANWIGYVAVSDDDMSARLGRSDIVVAWRGTVTKVEWIHDLLDFLRPVSSCRIPCLDDSVKVESGFEKLYTSKQTIVIKEICQSPREQVLEEIERLVGVYGDYKKDNLKVSITMTGHSLGSALAVLSAFDVAETGRHLTPAGKKAWVSVMSYAGPRVGNSSFKLRLERLGVKVFRMYNVHDVVPRTPGFLVNEHCPTLSAFVDELFPWSYSHVGAHLDLDHQKSTFLKRGLKDAHNLELLLHLIDGYQGKGQLFELATPRDIRLLNKDADLLHEKHDIPPFWGKLQDTGKLDDSSNLSY